MRRSDVAARTPAARCRRLHRRRPFRPVSHPGADCRGDTDRLPHSRTKPDDRARISVSPSTRRIPASGHAGCGLGQSVEDRESRYLDGGLDEYGSYSLGAVTVDPKDSNVVWLGTGENNNQRSVAFGDGIYKSTDAGKTWKRMGLENSEHIQNILVDPRTRTLSTSARSGRCGRRAAIAGSSKLPTAARRGNRCSRSAPSRASPKSRWIRKAPTSFTPPPISAGAPSDN